MCVWVVCFQSYGLVRFAECVSPDRCLRSVVQSQMFFIHLVYLEETRASLYCIRCVCDVDEDDADANGDDASNTAGSASSATSTVSRPITRCAAAEMVAARLLALLATA